MSDGLKAEWNYVVICYAQRMFGYALWIEKQKMMVNFADYDALKLKKMSTTATQILHHEYIIQSRIKVPYMNYWGK